MNSRDLQTTFAALLLAAAATSSAKTLRGELGLSATAHELLGNDAAALFGSAIDPEEVVEWELYVPRDYGPGSPAGLLV